MAANDAEATVVGWDARGGRGLARSLAAAAIHRAARRLRRGSLALRLPDGRSASIDGGDAGPSARLDVTRCRLLARCLLAGGVGFAQGYIEADWDTPDLVALLDLLAANDDAPLVRHRGVTPMAWARRLGHAARANSPRCSPRNVRAHYDLGDAFFAAWLDRHMLYSAARWEGVATLEEAQLAKCRALLSKIRLAPGEHLLEIGTGWGALAILAAREHGARVTSITLSPAQHDHAAARAQAEGLAERVQIRLLDYRDVTGRFDKVVSIEMVEAVGEAYWPIYFRRMRELTRPSGLIGLQLISIADRHFESYRRTPDFIQRHIFPGGMLPSPGALGRAWAQAGLGIAERETFGSDYVRTLRVWRARFEAAWPQLRAQGFDERFRRMWRYYLAYCEVGFRRGVIDVEQTVLRPL